MCYLLGFSYQFLCPVPLSPNFFHFLVGKIIISQTVALSTSCVKENPNRYSTRPRPICIFLSAFNYLLLIFHRYFLHSEKVNFCLYFFNIDSCMSFRI